MPPRGSRGGRGRKVGRGRGKSVADSIVEEKSEDVSSPVGIELSQNEDASGNEHEDLKSPLCTASSAIYSAGSTCYVKVENLVRPFAIADLKEFLCSHGGNITNFWINNIKSICYVQFESEISAQKAISKFDRQNWPEHNQKQLSVHLAEVDKIYLETGGELGDPPVVTSLNDSNQQKPVDQGLKRSALIDEDELAELKREDMKKAKELLTSVFRHTKALPMIYWLPSRSPNTEKINAREGDMDQKQKISLTFNSDLNRNDSNMNFPAKIQKTREESIDSAQALISYPTDNSYIPRTGMLNI